MIFAHSFEFETSVLQNMIEINYLLKFIPLTIAPDRVKCFAYEV